MEVRVGEKKEKQDEGREVRKYDELNFYFSFVYLLLLLFL